MPSDTTILIALGGNALAPNSGTVPEQFAQTRAAMDMIMPFVRHGHRLAITHGNGPQGGDELLRGELAAHRVPPLPLLLLLLLLVGQAPIPVDWEQLRIRAGKKGNHERFQKDVRLLSCPSAVDRRRMHQ